MKNGVNFLSSALVAAFFAVPLTAWAHSNPDFDDDAKPILKMQPGLVQYVESTYDIKDTGVAKYPGDDDHHPSPPFIFRARPLGSNGPYNLRLLIQPGPPGHILGVVDITKVHLTAPANPSYPSSRPAQPPAVASEPPPPTPYQPSPAYQTPPPYQPAPETPGPVVEPPPVTEAPAPSAPPPTAQPPSEPTADTPSGPIMDSGSQAPSSGQPSLAPPPDPAPPAQ